ncbi:MAG: RICIN domain-containing protein, partial [Oscillospiraceae bacterium]|nr:RICIN domain-containing protein [Oscillospiraceae bacterium]
MIWGQIMCNGMKKRLLSILLCLAMLLAFLPAAPVPVVHAATTSQQNIVARANYLYNATWVCQKTVAGWKGNYTFYKGTTYHIPYGQPVYAGAYVGFGVSVDDYLAAAADANSVFYTSQSNYAGKTSTYYATDCSAYVSWSWGVARQTTATIPNMSTYIGAANTSNIKSKLQLGDCLNSTSAGHVVLVTGLTYDSSGTLTQIEITEQTPPQLKRSYYTPSSLASKYSGSYSIYRYTGTVAAAPNSSTSATTSFGVKITANMKHWVFNADYYRNNNEDLASMTDDQLYTHYLDYGLTEGRQGSALFSIKYYTNQNEDLKAAYGSDYEAAFEHFITYGQYEPHRLFSKQFTAVRDVIFDPDVYRTKYPNVYANIDSDDNRLLTHFLKVGLSKGYSASAVFDVTAYINENSGLTDIYKDDYYGAVHHFIEYGQNESRVVSPILDTTYYTATYEDAAGMVAIDAMRHFLSTGIPEGRRGTEGFLKEYYYFTYADSLADYTVDTCYLHYLYSGYADGLRGAPYAIFPEEHSNLGAGFTATLTNLKTGLNWSIYSSTDVILYTPSDSDAQKWKFVRQSDGSYEITNVKYGTVLTATENGTSAGMVVIAEDVDGTHQRWFLYERSGYYCFRTACNDWISIGISGSDATSGSYVEMANFRDNNGQKYTINVLSVDIEECVEHSYLSSVTTEPTCTTDGVTTYTCVNCADSYTQTIPATGHDYACVVTEVGCTTDGVTTYTCDNCGDIYTEDEIAATGHDWQDATCTAPKTCAVCGLTEGEALGHSYEAVVTAPTCTDEGYTSYICSACGDTYAVPGEAATGHSFADWVEVKAPTCTTMGQLKRTCANCGSYQIQDVATTDHTYEDGVCTGCGAEDPDAVVQPSLSLNYGTVSFESEIMYNIYFNASNLDDVVEMGMITFDSQLTDGTIDDAVKVYSDYSTDGTLYMVATEGISAKYIGDQMWFKIYAKLSDGSYVYTTVNYYSAVRYAN